MEQQLQVTAGDLAEAERRLKKATSKNRSSLRSSRSTAEDLESSHIVMAGGHLVSVNSIRRDYGSMMEVKLKPISHIKRIRLLSMKRCADSTFEANS